MRYVSEGIERLTGYPAEHFTGDGAQRYCALIHPDDRDWARLAPERGSHELTYRLRHADGSTVWFASEPACCMTETTAGWCDGFIWDVTAQARAEAEMLERERYLRMLIDNVIDAIVIIDEHGLVESFNHAAERIFGYRSDEIVGRNLSLLMPEPVRSRTTITWANMSAARSRACWSGPASCRPSAVTVRCSASSCASRNSATTASASSSAWCATSANASVSSG